MTCDITDKNGVANVLHRAAPDFIIILSAVTFVPDGLDREIYDINLFGPLHILQAATTLPKAPRRIIVPSTAHVYGNATEGSLTETHCPNPLSHYALSKYAMEQMIRPFRESLDLVTVRPFNYTGAGQADHFLIPKLVRHFRDCLPEIELGNMDVFRDFSDVRDVVAAYTILLEAESPPEVLNVCSGDAVCIRQILEWLHELTGHTPEVSVNPAFVRANEVRYLYGCNEKLCQLGWRRKYHLQDTLRWMLRAG